MQSRLHQAADFTLHYNAPLSFLKPRRRKTDLTKRGKVGSIESQSHAGAPSSMPAGSHRKPYLCGKDHIRISNKNILCKNLKFSKNTLFRTVQKGKTL